MPNELARELARILGDDASLNELILAAEAPPPQPLLADEVRTWATANRDRVLALVGSSLPPARGWKPTCLRPDCRLTAGTHA